MDMEFLTHLATFIMGMIFAVSVLSQTSGKKRDIPPATYTVEIKSFEKLFNSQASLERFESGLFKAGGYNWRLVFYPNGNSTDGGAGHISLYLKIDQCSLFPDNWSVRANYKFFLHDRKSGTYITFQDAEERRFDRNKKEWGCEKFISLQTFNLPSNGFLFEDSCLFGAEVLVIKTTDEGETISIVNNPRGSIQIWKITNFSNLDETVQLSDDYVVGDRKWRLEIFPKGIAAGKDEFLAISLALVDCNDPTLKDEVYANFKLRLVERVRQKNWEQEYWKWFSTKSSSCYDLKFIKLEMLLKDYNGYLVDDTLIIELQFLYISDVIFHG